MDSETLLSCPFCGGEAEIKRKGSARASMVIACTDCGCLMESGDVYGLTAPKFWAWNIRLFRSCKADRDGECSHKDCPQLRDGEPGKTGRSCPLR